MSTQVLTFQTERGNLANWRLHEHLLDEAAPDSVVARVKHFALTANNITYGVAGDSIGYWQFFPAPDRWGCIPVWGFGDVIESNHPDVNIGERLYGYFPMATHVALTPTQVRTIGFVDGAPHRASLPAGYNQYTRVAADPSYDVNREAEQMLYRPLFTTSFFLDDFLESNDFFGAEAVILTSASSKTSLGLAHLLHRRANQDGRDRCRVIGLTSASNRAFVESLGCYDTVEIYDSISSLALDPSVMVDMAGNSVVRQAVHEHFGDALKYSCAVGATHWDQSTVGGGSERLPGPKPVMFFAPTQIQIRVKEWGREVFEEKMAVAWRDFMEDAGSWIRVEPCHGADALTEVYEAFINGSADPARGYTISL
jgi:hypothetical protein